MGDGCQMGVIDAKKGCQGIWEKQPHCNGGVAKRCQERWWELIWDDGDCQKKTMGNTRKDNGVFENDTLMF
jgi:hypothetical protein